MKYVANPIEVDAFRITHVLEEGLDGVVLRLEDGRQVTADSDMTARMTPVPGDYWVVQSDGYSYLNPKEVFERKYRPKESTDGQQSD